ncbi:acyl-CoA carboxylase subunit beta [Bradyrhizobium manausense]|uniref:acyl-CoA carboxylase subunit beta n=1 Tax=Bradyrhizobium manausense TaxID=989370 RepID=UPI002013972B|nr:carboxyl transferase domain-containing protein [Bradyrhizobium manausense]
MKTAVATGSDEFKRNRAHYLERIADLQKRRMDANQGGSAKARALHKSRGQLLPRERIAALIDPGSPFLELGHLAGEGMYDGVPPGATIITGVGQVCGRSCMLIANDATVKGGTLFGMTTKKHTRAQLFAWQHRLPCITLVQSGGGFLPDIANIFPDEGQAGSIMYNQVKMSAENIAQIAVVHGPSTAGGAYIPALCDEVVIVRNQGAMFLGSPQLVFAATGETIEVEPLGGAEMHSRISGVTDHLAENDSHALAIVRNIVANLGEPPRLRWTVEQGEPPCHAIEEIYGIVSANRRIPTDNREIVARLIDGSRFQEFKHLHGETMMCGFARINGFEIGILANNGVLFSESAIKGAHFIQLCCKRDIPLLFLVDVSGFMVGSAVERQGIAKHGAKFMTAMACADVPKYTIITGGSYAAAYFAMLGRAFKPNATLMWPNAHAALMGPEQAATTLAMVRDNIHRREGTSWTDEQREEFKQPIRRDFEAFADPYNFARNLWCDMVIDPVETRDVMALLLDLAGRTPAKKTKFGVFRM